MAITIQFEIEDGSAKSDATSYASVDQFRQYHLNIGADYTDEVKYGEDKIKAWLNKATAWIGSHFSFIGSPVDDDQALDFPRYDLIDANGFNIDSDIVPKEVADATCYVAGLLAEGIEINQINRGIASESTSGIGSAQYTKGGMISFPEVDALLSPFHVPGAKIVRVN